MNTRVTAAVERALDDRQREATEEVERILAAAGARVEELSIPELRWTRAAAGSPAVAVSLRSAIGLLESYEPFCLHTTRALARYGEDPSVSSTSLQTELTRVQRSPIVLNRGLREAVLAGIGRGEATMSEIAMRCGWLSRSPRFSLTIPMNACSTGSIAGRDAKGPVCPKPEIE